MPKVYRSRRVSAAGAGQAAPAWTATPPHRPASRSGRSPKQTKIKQLEAEIHQLRAKLKLVPEDLKPGPYQDSIIVNGIELKWDVPAGQITFRGLPVAMLWVDTTLAGLMAGVAAMVGPERFSLALQAEGRKGVESDWLIISRHADFREGFDAIHGNAAVAGWGDWRLIDYDLANGVCLFRAYNNWEGLYQKALGVCWGSGLLAGKFAGICTKLFNTNCWATQTQFVAKGDEYDEFIVKASPRSVEQEIDQLLASNKATMADLAVAYEELQKTQQGLRESENRFRSIFEQAPLGISVIDSTTGKFLQVNSRYCEIVGRTAEQLLKLNYWTLTYPEDLQADLDRLEYLRKGITNSFNIEKRYVHSNGSIVWVELTIVPLWSAGEISRLHLSMIQDITARKQAEEEKALSVEALKASEERNKVVTEMTTDYTCIVDVDGRGGFRLRWASESMYRLTGRTVEQTATSDLWTNIIHPDDRERFFKFAGQIIATAQPGEFECRAFTAFGATRWIQIFVRPQFGNEHQVIAIVGAIKDVTERKHAESQKEAALEALRELNLTLEQRVTERTAQLQAANARLTELDRLKDEFIARVSHELRSPLANIKIHLALLTTGQPDKREHYLKTLDRQTDRLHHLIENVLAFSELNLRDEDFSRELLDLNDLLQSRAPAWQRAAARHDLTFNLQLAASLPQVRADGPAIVQALAQVIDNALSYTRAGAVTVTSAPREMDSQLWVTVSVRDTGPGIAPAEAPRIFERFYRGRAAADYKIPGTGVGLPIARQMIERLGGHLTVESSEGQGATFTIWLPATSG